MTSINCWRSSSTTFDGPTIAKGEKPNLSAALAPKLTGYMVKTDSSGAKLDGVHQRQPV